MPLYDYSCDCGASVCNVIQGMNDSHTLTCPDCGEAMWQDYAQYKPPAIMGELPTRGAWNYFDPVLGAKIESRRQRDDLMAKKGLKEFHMEHDQEAMHQEVKYIQKHAPKMEKRKAINSLAKETLCKKEEARVTEVIDKVVDRTMASLPS